jgi:addiction module RelE/StbE family toxin
MEIYYSHFFKKKLTKLNQKEKEQIIEKVNIFIKDPFAPSLKTHKLTGKLSDYWSFSITYHVRIMFRFRGNETAEFIDIGTHGIYK